MTLYLISWVYLAVPSAIFFLGWIRPEISIPLLGILLFSTYRIIKIYWAPVTKVNILGFLSRKDVVLICLFSMIITAASGAGYILPQNTDWLKHNAVLYDLVKFPWPFGYTYPHIGETVSLSYYLAWYIVPALFGKIFGLGGALIVQYVWTAIGISLVMVHVSCLFDTKRSLYAIIAFIITPVSTLLFVQQYINFVNLAFFSNLSSLSLTPGPWIATTLISVILIRMIGGQSSIILALAWATLGIFWGPIGLLGLTPSLILISYESLKNRKLFTHLKLIVLVCSISFIFAMLFRSNIFNIQYRQLFLKFVFPATTTQWISYIVHFSANILLSCILLYFSKKYLPPRYYLLGLLNIAWMTIISFIQYGVFNDLVTRGSMASVFQIGIFVTILLIKAKKYRFILAVFTAFMLFQNIQGAYQSVLSNKPTPFQHLTEFESSDVLTQQYLSYTSSFFSRKLAKPIVYIYRTQR